MLKNVSKDVRELKIDELEIVSAAGMRKSGGEVSSGTMFLKFVFKLVAVK
ncbi:hypothetical protein JQ604_16005 [Bradyrhizobium jicamae]|nr:hypothetical protein [Bradyrhizobium jicamae]MBR0753692.1 hypothetical protein [Bradyrhizobium jicamae]